MGEVKRNCWTCGLDDGMHCTVAVDDGDVVLRWMRDNPVGRSGYPSPDADGCPGWKPKPGGEPWPEHIKVGARLLSPGAFVFPSEHWDVLSLHTDPLEFRAHLVGTDRVIARFPIGDVGDFVPAVAPEHDRPDAESTDRAQVASWGERAESVQAEIDRIESTLDEMQAQAIRATGNVGWRGHRPIAGRGPGHTTAMRLRRAGLPVRARKVRR